MFSDMKAVKYFLVAYDGGLEIDDMDIIECELIDFELPDDAKLVGCYESEDRASEEMFIFSKSAFELSIDNEIKKEAAQQKRESRL